MTKEDAGDRTMHGAIAENRSVRVVHEEGLPREPCECYGYRPGGVPPGWRYTSTELM
jgi:hypothetical protein